MSDRFQNNILNVAISILSPTSLSVTESFLKTVWSRYRCLCQPKLGSFKKFSNFNNLLKFNAFWYKSEIISWSRSATGLKKKLSHTIKWPSIWYWVRINLTWYTVEVNVYQWHVPWQYPIHLTVVGRLSTELFFIQVHVLL